MEDPERDPTIARSDRERDAALLEQKVAEPRRARQQRTSRTLWMEMEVHE